MNNKKKMFLIKIPYWLGIGADALWSIGLFFPTVFALFTGRSDLSFDLQSRLIMGIGGVLMAGWTVLLLWGVKKPIERRGVILITAFPAVFGLFIIALIGFLNGSALNLWIIIKTSILFILMILSYILARQVEKTEIRT